MTERTRLDKVLTEVKENVFDTFIATSDQARTAMTLISAVQHAVQSFYTVPHMAWVSKSTEGSTGKSDAMMRVAELGPNPVDGSDTTPYALGSSLQQAQMQGKPYPTMHFDELSSITGASGLGGAQHFIPKHIRRSYKRGAKGSKSRGDVALEWEIFGICLMTGLVTCLPRDIARRTIRIWMVEDTPAVAYRARRHDPLVARYRDALKVAVQPHAEELSAYWLPSLHPRLTGRMAEIWEPLFAVATTAGGAWPKLCLEAFMELGVDETDTYEPTPDEQCVLDVAEFLAESGNPTRVLCRDVLNGIKGKQALYRTHTDRDMERMLSRTLGAARDMRIGTEKGKGWVTEPITDLAAQIKISLTSEDEPEEIIESIFDVSVVSVDESNVSIENVPVTSDVSVASVASVEKQKVLKTTAK